MKRTFVKTQTGYTVYGAFTSVMHADANKKVTYSNMVPDSAEYRRMLAVLKASL